MCYVQQWIYANCPCAELWVEGCQVEYLSNTHACISAATTECVIIILEWHYSSSDCVCSWKCWIVPIYCSKSSTSWYIIYIYIMCMRDPIITEESSQTENLLTNSLAVSVCAVESIQFQGHISEVVYSDQGQTKVSCL